MAYALFNSNDKKNKRSWCQIQKALPGAKDVLQEVCTMLTLIYGDVLVRKNMKSLYPKKSEFHTEIHRYHIENSINKYKFCTIYVVLKDKGETIDKKLKIRLFNDKDMNNSEVYEFSTLEELRELTMKII